MNRRMSISFEFINIEFDVGSNSIRYQIFYLDTTYLSVMTQNNSSITQSSKPYEFCYILNTVPSLVAMKKRIILVFPSDKFIYFGRKTILD